MFIIANCSTKRISEPGKKNVCVFFLRCNCLCAKISCGTHWQSRDSRSAKKTRNEELTRASEASALRAYDARRKKHERIMSKMLMITYTIAAFAYFFIGGLCVCVCVHFLVRRDEKLISIELTEPSNIREI